jgi:predicted MFS family arabinose efflux permease
MGLKSYPRLYFELIYVGFAVVMGMGLSTSFLPLLASDIDDTGFLVGFVVSAFFFSRVFIEIPAGIISDRIGRRKLLIIGLGLYAVGAFLCAQASTIHILILGRAIWGLGTAFFFMTTTALLIDIFESKARGTALGIFQGIEFIGNFIGTPIGAFLAAVVSYADVFYFTFALALSSFVVALSSKSLRTIKSEQTKRAKLPVASTLNNIRKWSIMLICAITFFRMLIMNGIFSTVFQLYLYLDQQLAFSLESIGIVLSVRTAGLIISTLGSGYLANRFGKKPIAIVGLLISAAGLAAYTAIYSLEMFYLVALFEGFGQGLIFTTLTLLLAEVTHPSVMGTAIGVNRTFMDIGGVLGPLIFMVVYESFNPQATFFLGLAITIVNLALMLLIRTKTARNE